MLHMDRLIDLKGESVAVREMRKHLAWYLKGLPDSASVKDSIMDLTTRSGVVSHAGRLRQNVWRMVAADTAGSRSRRTAVH